MSSARHARERKSVGSTIAVGGILGLDEATQAFDRAEYEQCRLLLSVGVAAARTRAARGAFALVEARCARVRGDHALSLERADYAASHHADPAARFEAVALRAHAHRRLGDPTSAEREFDALRRAHARDPEILVGLPLYYLALVEWFAGRYDVSDALMRHNVERGAALAYSLSLLGWSEIRRERYGRAGAYFLDALVRQRAVGDGDVRSRAMTLHAACAVASETVDLHFARKVVRELDGFVWPESLGLERFHTLLGAHAIALLEGDRERAWSLAREAAVRAPSVATAALGEIASARVSRSFGDTGAVSLGFRRAWELVRRRRGPGDEELRTALCAFATDAASEMPVEARKAMALYESLAREPANGTADRRVVGSELLMRGRVAEASGDRDAARTAYVEALGIWQALRFDMRAATVARDLRRLTRDRTYDAAVGAVLARAPKAWVDAHDPASNDVLDRITPAEKLVLGAMLEGKSARAIASDLERSVHTVNNHTRKIFKAFEVTSRSGVLARCAALGITPKTFGRTERKRTA
ncbi:MAG: hypothetical protein NVS2B3_04750 [Vulcanimicrobiaceae bacterium]